MTKDDAMMTVEDMTQYVVELEEAVEEWRSTATPVSQHTPAELARLRAAEVEATGFWDNATTVRVSTHGAYAQVIRKSIPSWR